MEKKIKNRIFVIVSPGCEETWTQLKNIIQYHLPVEILPPFYLFYFLAKGKKIDFLEGIKSSINFNRWLGDHLSISVSKIAFSKKKFIQQYIQTLDEYTLSQGKTCWLNEAVLRISHINFLKDHFDNYKIVHLLSEPKELSSKESPKGDWPLEQNEKTNIKQWWENFAKASSYSGHDNHFVLYEKNLYENFSQTLTDFTSFLNLDRVEGKTISELKKGFERSLFSPDHIIQKQLDYALNCFLNFDKK